MENKGILKIAAGVVLIPMALGAIASTVDIAIKGVGNLISKVQFKRKIKKGLKDGSIVEIDGQYYEISIDDVEGA